MRILFLIAVFIPFVLTVHAQRASSKHICQLSHKHSQKAFYLSIGESRKIEFAGWVLYAGLRREGESVIISLRRVVDVLGATYQREATQAYSRNENVLPVRLQHHFGGKLDVFNLVCYPRAD